MIPSPSAPARVSVLGLVLVLAGLLWAGVYAERSPSWHPGCYEVNICDSLTFRVVAELAASGQNPYREAVRLEHVSETRLDGAAPLFDLPFQYPPNALPVFAPRGWGSPRLAHMVSVLVSTLAFLSVAWLLVRRDVTDPLGAGLLFGSLAIGVVVAFNAQLGQTGALAAALVVGAALCWRERPLVAGVLIGALAFKPQYALPLALVALVRGDRQIILGSAAAFAAMCLGSGIVYGFTQWRHFIAVVGEPNYTVNYMVNWMGLAWRFAPEHPWVEHGALPSFVGAMAGFLALLWTRGRRASLAAQVAAALALAVVASPNTHPYDLLVLTPALVHVSAARGGLVVGPVFYLLTWVLLPPPMRWMLALALVCFAVLTLWQLVRDGERRGVSERSVA